ncbi:MAG TPA: hypothetical protein VNQ56_18260 [Pseudolabrys sp.]|nr:hypothetical protein [Pseudolabrys sp.]
MPVKHAGVLFQRRNIAIEDDPPPVGKDGPVRKIQCDADMLLDEDDRVPAAICQFLEHLHQRLANDRRKPYTAPTELDSRGQAYKSRPDDQNLGGFIAHRQSRTA